MNVEFLFWHPLGQVQISDAFSVQQPYTSDVRGLSPAVFVQTSWIDFKPAILDNDLTSEQETTFAFPCAEYPSSPFAVGRIRMMHKTQKLECIRELQVTGSGASTEWQTDERAAGIAQCSAQLYTDVALISGEDSALLVSVNDKQISL